MKGDLSNELKSDDSTDTAIVCFKLQPAALTEVCGREAKFI